jgi:hypothetical protein
VREEQPKYEGFIPHRWDKLRFLPWLVCRSCGLIRARNLATDWCVRMGCDHEWHPQYKATMRALTRSQSR